MGNEPPLLEELGIHPEHIVQKTLSVLNPMRKTTSDVAGDADLAGPLTFCLAFGALLLLSGKVHFNYIYGIGGLGCATIYALLRLMNVRTDVSATCLIHPRLLHPSHCGPVWPRGTGDPEWPGGNPAGIPGCRLVLTLRFQAVCHRLRHGPPAAVGGLPL